MLDIMNAALVAQGEDEILTINDGSNEWRLLSRQWPLIVEAEMEDGGFQFSKMQEFLASRKAGKFGYSDAYLVPEAALHVKRVWTEESGTRDTSLAWAQDGERVYVDCSTGIFIEYAAAMDPGFWNANFSMGVNLKLQAVLLNFKEEQNAASAMNQAAEAYFQRARTNQSKGRSTRPMFNKGEIALARFRRG